MLRHNSFSYPLNEFRSPYELGQGQLYQAPLNNMVSQTPRLKATKLGSPILGGYDCPPAKRAISVLDQEYDLMGLSKNNALDEDSFMMGNLNSFAPALEDLNQDVINVEQGFKMPYHSALEPDFLS